MPLQYYVAASARARLDAAAAALDRLAPGDTALIVGHTRAAADEFAFAVARVRGGLFGVTRSGILELVTRLALPALAASHRSPMSALGTEALVTRAAFDAERDGRLRYFQPVAHMPGFPRAAARTLQELQLADVESSALRSVGLAGEDLGELLERLHDGETISGRRRAPPCLRKRPGRSADPQARWMPTWFCCSTSR